MGKMPNKLLNTSYNVGYPIYGAKFLNESTLLVAGGGGQGNNGIPNKISALKIDFDKKKVVKRFRELTLNENDDSPTTLDCSNNVILMGCNESSEKIKSGRGNNHLRKYVYENEHLKFVASIDLDESTKPENYTKLTYMSPEGSVAAIASSNVPTVIRIVNPSNLRETYEVETGNDVKDMHFSPDGKVLSYITASTLEVMSIVTGNFIVRKTDFDKNWALSKIRFIDQDNVVITATLKKGNGVVLMKISLKSGIAKLVKHKVITTKFRGVTSMDVSKSGELVALAGNENSILIVTLRNFHVTKFFKQVHTFAITKIAFSPNGSLLASVSAANTVHVVKIPERFAVNPTASEYLFKILTNVIFVLTIAVLAHYTQKNQLHYKIYNYAASKYSKYTEKNDSSSYFILNDYPSQTTLSRETTTSITSSARGLVENTIELNQSENSNFLSSDLTSVISNWSTSLDTMDMENDKSYQTSTEPVAEATNEPIEVSNESESEITSEPIQTSTEPVAEATNEPIEVSNESESEATNEPIQTSTEPEVEATNEPIEVSNESESEATNEPIQTSTEPEAEATNEPIEVSNESESEATNEPIQTSTEPEAEATNEPIEVSNESESEATNEPIQTSTEPEAEATNEPIQTSTEPEAEATNEPIEVSNESESEATNEPIQTSTEPEAETIKEPIEVGGEPVAETTNENTATIGMSPHKMTTTSTFVTTEIMSSNIASDEHFSDFYDEADEFGAKTVEILS